MKRISFAAAISLALVVSACGEKNLTEAVEGAKGSPTKPPAGDGRVPTPAGAAKAWSSVDTKGHDWAAQMGAIHFDTDWQAAMARAKAEKKPLMFLFTEKSNADAVKMGGGTLKDSRVVAASADFVTALVNAEDNAPLAERYGVQVLPMIVYASPTGEAAGDTLGGDAEQTLRDIKAALGTLKEDADEAK